MHKYSNEDARSADVQARHADLFGLAEALFNVWLTYDKDKWVSSSLLPAASANLAMILDVQASRLFRSVFEECKRAEAFSASILARTLFETVLCVGFLLKEDVRIIVEPNNPKGSPPGTAPTKWDAKIRSKQTKRTRRHLLSHELRADLFLAYGYIQLEGKGIASMGRLPGKYHEARRLKKNIDPSIMAEYEREIGPEWSYILRHSKTCAGLSVKDLARVVHKECLRWYDTIYHTQSVAVHAMDILKHVYVSDDGATLGPVYLSSESEVYRSLWSATGLYLAHLHMIQASIGFGTEMESSLHSLKRKFNAIASS